MGFEVVGFVPMAPAASRRSARASSPGLPRPVVPTLAETWHARIPPRQVPAVPS